MIKTILFTFTLVGSLVGLIIGFIQFAMGSYQKVKKTSLMTLIFVIGLLTISIVSQRRAHTPEIDQDTGIAELIQVDVNGKKEWVSIRGKDKNNPIILFLAGGPGGSQLGAVRRNLAELEEEFVVVNWEQPGSGKSYQVMPINSISVNTYIEDGLEITNYLRNRFERDKIYLMGESWGSLLGIFLAKEMPESYYAFIGTGQMVDFAETEQRCYDLALQRAKEKSDTDTIEELNKIGPPPYSGKNIALKAGVYLQYLSGEMSHNPNIHNPGYETLEDLASEEYGVIDQINYIRGIVTTFSNLYPQLWDIDLRQGYTEIDIPIYMFVGRHDLNAPTDLAEEYFNLLQAPDKKLIWFEHSGHSPWINENNLFCEKTIHLFVQHENEF